jgi:transcriptional regulator with XRE-family HTH domain
VNEQSKKISKLKESDASRIAYIKAKLSVLIPSQIKALRFKSGMTRQEDLANAANMLQSRISAMEKPGAVNFNLETLVRLASAFKVGLIVKFVPFSEMLRWENQFSQDSFKVTTIDKDSEFLNPPPAIARKDMAATAPTLAWLNPKSLGLFQDTFSFGRDLSIVKPVSRTHTEAHLPPGWGTAVDRMDIAASGYPSPSFGVSGVTITEECDLNQPRTKEISNAV